VLSCILKEEKDFFSFAPVVVNVAFSPFTLALAKCWGTISKLSTQKCAACHLTLPKYFDYYTQKHGPLLINM
jgi:hypothetical protein